MVGSQVTAHVFAGPMNPGAALTVKLCGKIIAANAGDGALSHTIYHLTYFLYILNIEAHKNCNICFKSYENFAEFVYGLHLNPPIK